MPQVWSEVLARPQVLAELVRRDIQGRFVGSRFGLLWSFLTPTIQLASYSLIFGYLYGGPVGEAEDAPPFVASLFCGLWAWWGFNEGVLRGMSALVDQSSLLKKMPISPASCVVAAATGSVLLQLVGFLLFLVTFAAIGMIEVGSSWLLLPVVAVLGWLLTLGIALALAPVQLIVRDTVQLVSAALTVGFFVSPVLYASSWLPETARQIAAFNPLTGLLGLYRTAVLGLDVPGAVALSSLSVALVVSWVVATWLFTRLESVLDEYW